MNIHDLKGCAPTPLAHYLKALGILRLVTEQADPQARGWWEGENFMLATELEQAELLDFILFRYEPTPIFNPWGGRSGFYGSDSEKTARSMLQAIEASPDPRFKYYQEIVKIVRKSITETTGGIKPDDDTKDRLILNIRCSVRGKALLWLDAVTALVGTNVKRNLEPMIEQPALFGTGGNEGSGSYTSAYMAAINECLLKHSWDHALTIVLFGESKLPNLIWDQSMGQFVPGGASAPWDLLLAFEGACLIRSAVSSRSNSNSRRWMSSPFYVAPASYGYPSEARLDEYAMKNGKELPGRGEQWFPLWDQPMRCSELAQIFVEGRATSKRNRAMDGWSMARAICHLGVRRGIREFIRYGYQQRNNLATHFAVPLGRFRVPDRVYPRLSCLDDLDAWLGRLRRDARARQAPARLQLVERRLADALFAVIQHPEEANRWQSVLLSLADVERMLASGKDFRAGPIPSLRPEWVAAADDGSAVYRLAVACALQAAGFRKDRCPIDAVRRHWISSNDDETAVVMKGRSGLDDAIALIERRLIEAGQRGERRLRLAPAYRVGVTPPDLTVLLSGTIDLGHVMTLARALAAVDGSAWGMSPCPPRPAKAGEAPDDAWLAIRLAMLPWPLRDGRKIGVDPAIFRRLASGDGQTAVELALRRLKTAGIHATVRVATTTHEASRLWAAALAFPITKKTAAMFLNRLERTEKKGDLS